MGYLFLVKILLIAKIFNIPLFVIKFAIILQEVLLLSKELIRKHIVMKFKQRPFMKNLELHLWNLII